MAQSLLGVIPDVPADPGVNDGLGHLVIARGRAGLRPLIGGLILNGVKR
jgi:hypothetical protein